MIALLLDLLFVWLMKRNQRHGYVHPLDIEPS